MRTVFLDTVGLIAVWDRADQWHAAANQAMTDLDLDGAYLITTSFVLLECGNAAARKPFRLAVDRLWGSLSDDGRLVVPTEADVSEAWSGYRRGEAGQAGIVDQTSFVVMRRLGITQAFTSDQHFQAAGFETLF